MASFNLEHPNSVLYKILTVNVNDAAPLHLTIDNLHVVLLTSDGGDFWAQSVGILVFASPTVYMLTSFGRFSYIKLGYIL